MATGGKEMDKQSDETFDFVCTMCKNEGKNTEAVKYCTNCSDYYCLGCMKIHDTVPVLKGHLFVEKGQFQKGSGKLLPTVPTERCDKHCFKPVDMYCKNHDDVGCSNCMTVKHRLCPSICYIPEYIQQNKSTHDPEDILQKLNSNETLLAENLLQLEQEKQLEIERNSECIQEIRQSRKDINKKLDELETASVAVIENKHKELMGKIDEEIRRITKTQTRVSLAKDKLASVDNNISQAFVSTKIGQKISTHADQCLEKMTSKSQGEDVRFILDQTLTETLKKMDVLGRTVQKCSRKADEKQRKNAHHVDSLLQVKSMKMYPIKIKSDRKACNIISSCVLEDGTIILADYDNEKLKRFDMSTHRVEDHYNLPGYPFQVCAINSQEVAVSYERKEIMFIALGIKMRHKSLIKTDLECYGLAYANINFYVAHRDASVCIYSVSGRKLKQFGQNQSEPGLFSDIYSLAVSNNGSRIYVADSTKGLIVLDNNGQVVPFKCPELKRANNVYLTSSGAVLVCGRDLNNVLQLGPDGVLKGEVLKSDGGMKRCQTVCCDQQMSKMIVGRYNNQIEVYDLA